MPFALLIIGTVLLVAASRNTQGDLFALVKGDFSGPGNFVFWFAAIFVIGALGYVPKLKPLSTAFLALVIIVLILARGNPNTASGGLFAKLTQQLNATKTPQPDAAKTLNLASTLSSIPNLVM